MAAYSTVRALYRGYLGPLYRVTRVSDGTSTDIGVQSPGGYANAAKQDAFCAGTICTITRLYDQSPERNDLGIEPIGGNGSPDVAAIANALPVVVGGHHVYGVSVQAGVGYRNDVTRGVPAGAQPQGAYMVTSGQHTDPVCCFDFGNAETSNTDTGNGHMDAIYFGNLCWFGSCPGTAPLVEADMENGLFAGGNGPFPGNAGNGSPFVTAMLKNNGTTTYALKDGNAASGALTTEYEGPLPDIGGYTPMQQEGSVLLGTGGDDSNGSDGSFFEGVITAGYPSTDDRQRRPGEHRRDRVPSGACLVPRRRDAVRHHQRQQRLVRAARQLRDHQRHRDGAVDHRGDRLPEVDVRQRGQRPLHHHQRQQRHRS